MCVIMLANDTRPTEEMVEKAFSSNGHGGGVAWRDLDAEGKPEVRWAKGLDLEEMKERCASMPLPFVAHFRIASCGGQSPALCHPFPIDGRVPLFLEGKTKGYVLFHNGHWAEWKSFTKETALKKGAKIPTGKWSDSRAMALAAFHYGLGILEMIDEKVIAFGPEDLEIFSTGWSKPTGIETSLYVSNKHWEHSGGNWRQTRGNSDWEGSMDGYEWCGGAQEICREVKCNKRKYMNTDFCFEHQPKQLPSKAGFVGPLKEDGGGATEQRPFCKPSQAVPGRQDQPEADEKGKEQVRGKDEAGRPPTGFSNHSLKLADEMLRWAKSLNPKVSKNHGGSVIISAADRAQRLIDLRNGVQRIGPM